MKDFRVFGLCLKTVAFCIAMPSMLVLSACHESSSRSYSAVSSDTAFTQNGYRHNNPIVVADNGTLLPNDSGATRSPGTENRQNGGSDPGHLYTSAPALEPTSSNSATRIYSEPGTNGTNGVNPIRTPVPPGKDSVGSSAAPQDEGMSDKDRELIHRIREQMMHDPAIAQIGPEVKLVVDNGKVKLVGNVNSEKEKSALKNFVQNSDGVATVDDQVEVKPSAQ
jgi:BON domain